MTPPTDIVAALVAAGDVAGLRALQERLGKVALPWKCTENNRLVCMSLDGYIAACAHGTEEFGSYCFGKSGGVRWRARWLDLRRFDYWQRDYDSPAAEAHHACCHAVDWCENGLRADGWLLVGGGTRGRTLQGPAGGEGGES